MPLLNPRTATAGVSGLWEAVKFDSFPGVLFGKKNRPRERFYLLPGQGGRNYHRKQRVILRWTVAVSLFFGALVAVVMWWMSRP